MSDEQEIALLKAALPIDDIDQMISSDLSFAIIWIDISERPDLQVLNEQDTLEDGYSICTFFYANPGKRNMRLGIRLEMKEPVHFVLPLVFKVRQYYEQLTTISRQGNFWVVPGPAPKHVTGSRTITAKELQGLIDTCGQGLFITLQDHMVTELRERLTEWKRSD